MSTKKDLQIELLKLEEEIELLTLTKRANNSNLPLVKVVDLRQELAKGNKSMLSDSLKEEIKVGTRLNNDDLIKLDVVVKISNYCKYNDVGSDITSIDTSNTADYIVYFEKEKKKIYLGNSSNLVEKMDSAVTIMEKEKNESREIFVREDLIERNRTYSREMK